jgi:hypothetical protein
MSSAAPSGQRITRIIAGSGRSGTTWVQDAFAEANDLRPVFEPLHPLAIPKAAPFAGRYLRPDSDEPGLEAYLTSVFHESWRNPWTDFRVRPDRLRPSLAVLSSFSSLNVFWRRWRKVYRNRRRYAPLLTHRNFLVKFIRANLMLAWIDARFDVRTLLVVRHPGAVVESRLRLGGDDWEPRAQLERYLSQPDLQRDYLFKYNPLLTGTLSAAETHAAIWCIENQNAMAQLSPTKGALVCYEHLAQGDETAWDTARRALALDHSPDSAQLSRPSQSTSARSAGYDQFDASAWCERLDRKVRERVGDILRMMDVTLYDVDDPMPRSRSGAGDRIAERGAE